MELYDKTDPLSIEEYARQLIDKSLYDYFKGNIEQKFQGKGRLGQLIEEEFFKYKINSNAGPDFSEAGVELKCTPLKNTRSKGFTSKERLVLNVINYFEEAKVDFRNSSFWHKNKHLLLMFYLWEQGKMDIDYVFKIISLWRFPANDLKIIKDDWITIHKKILAGKAEEISEGDTLYMAACMKGATKETSKRAQPYSDVMAQNRAYSLKNRYMNSVIRTLMSTGKPYIDEEEIEWILDDWEERSAKEPFETYKLRKRLGETEAIIKDINQYESPDETFMEYVERRFIPYYGMRDVDIVGKLDIEKSNAKSKFAIITKAILGIHKKNIEEFEKAGITVKTIRLSKTNTLKESMSFPTIKYCEIVHEEWEDSSWYETLNNKFFFVIYQEQQDGTYVLKNAFFWNMPLEDQKEAKKLFEDTKAKVQAGDFNHFRKISDSKICHVRPHGKNANDLMKAPDGSMQKKYCFWLNRGYIKKIIDDKEMEREQKEKFC